ncbi:hypothetical protein [Streptomyces sp. NBC_01637]|uniref:hypothetical protein n=1 Tax=unclassified Streptomyces TaxID=2593676 RepID=UPI003865C184|nr:hypothetical protein OH719_24390 [Streptomyces sp. NBC_01653]WTD90141.1 hypothetical protein OG891_22480 [Streptomyces sp. NBC_01637]
MGDPLTPINAAATSGARDPSWEGAEILAELVVTGLRRAGIVRRSRGGTASGSVRGVVCRDDLALDLPPDEAGSVLGLSAVRSAAVVPGGTVTAVPNPRAGSP